jgi:hypothetical protein
MPPKLPSFFGIKFPSRAECRTADDPSLNAANGYHNSLVVADGSGGQNLWLKSTILLVSSLSSCKSALPMGQEMALLSRICAQRSVIEKT